MMEHAQYQQPLHPNYSYYYAPTPGRESNPLLCPRPTPHSPIIVLPSTYTTPARYLANSLPSSQYSHDFPEPLQAPQTRSPQRLSHSRRFSTEYGPYWSSPRHDSSGYYAAAPDIVYIHNYSDPKRRTSLSTRPRPPPRSKKPVSLEAEAKKYGVPAGYSYKNWDPAEEPLMPSRITIRGQSYDANSLELLKILLGCDTNLLPFGPKPRPKMRRPMNRRKVLRVKIKNGEHLACPDSGSEADIMSEAFAVSLGLEIRPLRPQDIQKFELGNGKLVKPNQKRRFYVFSTCAVPLVLGMPFLKEMDIMTKNRKLLENCPSEMGTISSLLWIGSPKQSEKISCSLDGHDLFATADTGSDLNLISLKCARREGFTIDRRREARTRIKVGDGTETETVGQVYIYNLSLDWRKDETPIRCFDSTIDEGSTGEIEDGTEDSAEDEGFTGVIFHVLPNLPCDIIFGRSLLEQTDAFNLCPTLRDTSSISTETSSLPTISPPSPSPKTTTKSFQVFLTLGPVSISLPLRKRKHRKGKSNTAIDAKRKHDDERHAEMFRRSRVEDEMQSLVGDEYKIAATEEARSIKVWEDGHKGCGFC